MTACTPGTPTATSPTPTSAADRSSSCWPGWTRTSPATVVDLGCGPGQPDGPARRALAGGRTCVGLDSSPEMIEHGARTTTGRCDFDVADLRDWAAATRTRSTSWSPTRPCSGCPATSTCCRRWSAGSRPGGWFAFQVPGNFDEPSHTIRTALAAEAPYAAHTDGRGRAELARPGRLPATPCAASAATVDAWETTYLHVLEGEDPVFTWVSGTGARPTLQALPDDLRGRLRGGVQAAAAGGVPGPGRRHVVLPFRRVFVVAQVPTEAAPRAGRAARPAARTPRAGSTPTGSGLTEVDKPPALRGARRRLVPRVRRRRRGRRRAARRRRGAVRPGAQGAPGVPRRRPRRGDVPAQDGRLRGGRAGAGRRSRATCASTRSTRTATGSRSCRRL